MRRCVCVVLALALFACSSSEPSFKRDQLRFLVMQKSDAPAGTLLDASASGEQNLDQVVEGRTAFRAQLVTAGFVTSYLNEFVSPNLFQKGSTKNLSKKGSLAISFVMMFNTVDGASEGLQVLEKDVRARGKDLTEESAEGLGRESFGLGGNISPPLPPGFFYAWRLGNCVFGLIAAGAAGAIDQNAARDLADLMEKRAA